jgi:7,8-dihydropterin-6-yl-methyl-4-(beta-D-ribofuranosyl)aminobenzene 5'-phosphate synthase
VTTLVLEPVDRVVVTTVVDNTADMLLPDVGLVRRWGLSGTAGRIPVVPSDVTIGGATLDFLRAEHGYSALLEVTRAGRTHRVLYDTGVSPDGVVDNLDRLGVSLDTIEAIVLSHGHFDHVAGLHGLIHRMTTRGLPLVLHPDLWTRRRIVTADHEIELPTPSPAAVEGAGFAVLADRRPSFLLDGSLLVTGEVPRTTPFETGMPPGHQAWRDDGWQHDPLVHEDQAVVVHVRGRGLVVITGCGHAGIVNIVRQARALTGVEQVGLVVGGFHLRDGPVVEQSVAALAEAAPELIMPAHCTSWAAHQALYRAMPHAYRPNAVGSRIDLVADESASVADD